MGCWSCKMCCGSKHVNLNGMLLGRECKAMWTFMKCFNKVKFLDMWNLMKCHFEEKVYSLILIGLTNIRVCVPNQMEKAALNFVWKCKLNTEHFRHSHCFTVSGRWIPSQCYGKKVVCCWANSPATLSVTRKLSIFCAARLSVRLGF